MIYIPLGIQCSSTGGIRDANFRKYGYPFDWVWSPSKTTYTILTILLDGITSSNQQIIDTNIDKAIDYMTTGYTYYQHHNNEHFRSTDNISASQMNKNTGLGIVHNIINDEFRDKLRRRFLRLFTDICSNENILFIYADAGNPSINYYLDDVEYGVDGTEYLLKIFGLIHPINSNIKIVYFCWPERKRENTIIEYVPYDYKSTWQEVSSVINNYLVTLGT
jgi:hypothetical protein